MTDFVIPAIYRPWSSWVTILCAAVFNKNKSIVKRKLLSRGLFKAHTGRHLHTRYTDCPKLFQPTPPQYEPEKVHVPVVVYSSWRGCCSDSLPLCWPVITYRTGITSTSSGPLTPPSTVTTTSSAGSCTTEPSSGVCDGHVGLMVARDSHWAMEWLLRLTDVHHWPDWPRHRWWSGRLQSQSV